ncbi:hypothetical protein ES703_84881 [subsurface metagenome]
MLSFEPDTKGELGELGSHPDALSKRTKDKKVNKIGNKNGVEANSPNSLLATAQIQNSNSPFPEELPAAELKKMLEEYVELTPAKIIKLWKKKGSPEVPLGTGVKIGNLETYLEQGIVDVDQLGALGELVKEWKKLEEVISNGTRKSSKDS